LQFPNLERAKKTLSNFGVLGDRTDTSNGMTPSTAGKNTKMVITQEIRNQLLEWFNVVLSSKVHFLLPPSPQLLKLN
jgi:hypothetical protein